MSGTGLAAALSVLMLTLAPPALGPAAGSAGSAPHRRHVVLTFADPRIVEASGLVLRDGLFTTVNDSGDSGRVFTADRSGRTVGVTSWPEQAVDDEALAPWAHGTVLVGDIGDNTATRSSVTIRIVPVGRGDRTVTPRSYRLTYPGGPVDAETLLVSPGDRRVLVVTKGLLGGVVYAAPRRLSADHPNRLHRLGSALPVATDGAFFGDGRHVVIRNYGEAEIYTYPGLRPVAHLDLPRQPQGEGIAVDGSGRVFLSSEGADSRVLEVRLPAAVQQVVSLRPTIPQLPTPPTTGEPLDPSTPSSQASQSAPSAPSRPLWPWLLGGIAGAGAVGILLRSLRPRRAPTPR